MIDITFFELWLIFLAASVLGFIALKTKQPLILAYIVAGILLGPQVLDLLRQTDTVLLLSKIGIAFLLFIVGINLNFNVLKQFGLISLIIGFGQVIFTAVIGYFIAIALNLPPIAALYVAIALTFSSTIIIIKLLSDKNDLDRLYGKISIGLLLVQDFIAILIIILLNNINTNAPLINVIFLNLVKGIVFFIILALVVKYFITSIFERIAKSQELLFISSIAWCFFMIILAFALGFQIEIGAFLAGISLSVLPYHYEIASKVRYLRDLFIVLFFVLLGSQMVFIGASYNLFIPVLIFSLFILIGNPLIVMFLMGLSGYSKRTGFLTGLTVAQISEFSLILIAMGLALGHFSQEIATIVTMVGIVTITVSTYMILHNDKLYNFFAPYLNIFERKNIQDKKRHLLRQRKRYEVILIGCHRIGFNILKYLKRKKKKSLVVDYNPELIKSIQKQKIDTLYGDISDSDILVNLVKFSPKTVISSLEVLEDNIQVVKKFKQANKNTLVITAAKSMPDATKLYKVGADYVVLPEILAGQKVTDYLTHLKKSEIKKWGKHHLDQLLKDQKSSFLDTR